MRHIRLSPPTGNHSRFILAASIAAALAFAACERKPALGETALPVDPTVQPLQRTAVNDSSYATTRLDSTIGAFEKEPTPANQAWVKLAFTVVDAEIIELKDTVINTGGADQVNAASMLNDLQQHRDTEMIRYKKVQGIVESDGIPPADGRTAAQKVEDAAAAVGDKASKIAVKIGDNIGDEARKVGNTVKKEAAATGDSMKDATH